MRRYLSVVYVPCLLVVATLLTACDPGGQTGAQPAAPVDVTVTSGQGFITVTWQHDGVNATGFVVYREALAASGAAVTRHGELSQLAQVGPGSRSYRDDDVVVGMRYRYAVATKGSGSQLSSSSPQTGAPVELEPDPDPDLETIAEYVVGPGRVATVTSISGVIADYDGGAVDATFAGIFGAGSACPGDDPACLPSFTPGRPWVPTSIAADGSFTVDLPASPVLDDSAWGTTCGQAMSMSMNGVLYVHDAPFGQPGSSPSMSFARFRLEDPKTPSGFLADAALVVLYGYSSTSVDVTCVEVLEDEFVGEGPLRLDVDLRVRPGWNVWTWLQRSEGETMVTYMRTGEPDLPVLWVEPEPLY